MQLRRDYIEIPAITHFMYRAQTGQCFHCKETMNSKKFHPGKNTNGFTKEHIVPRSQHGPKGAHNFVLAHQKCNEVRAITPFTEEDMMRVKAIHNLTQDLCDEYRHNLRLVRQHNHRMQTASIAAHYLEKQNA